MSVTHPVKVCFVCYREQIGTVIDHFSRFVAENGFDVTVVFCGSSDQGSSSEDEYGREFFCIKIPGSRERFQSKRVFVYNVAAFLRNNDFSIVHFHNSFEYFGLGRLLSSCNSKFIFHTTTHPVSESPLRIAKRKAVEALQCLLMDAVIVQSEELRQQLPIIRNLARSTVIPVGYNGRLFKSLDSQRFKNIKEKYGGFDNCIVLIYIGSMAYFRRLERMIEGFSRARQFCDKLKLLMVGDGVALKELEAYTRELGVEKDVIFTGKISQEDMMYYLGLADIGISFVPIISSYNYNPPLKTFEYLACGLPVIATKTVSNCKIIIDEYNGILINDTPDGVCGGIIRLIQNIELRKYISGNASKSIEEYDFENITKKRLVPLYLRLIGY